MAFLKRFINRLGALVRSGRTETDLAREVQAHLTLLEDDLTRRGMTSDEARVAARRALGGIDQTKERHRDARSFTWLEDLRRDIPYALRGLRRTPGFTAAAILTLALGIGATTAVFSVVNAVLLQPLPYKDSNQLVQIVERVPARTPGNPPGRRTGMTWSEFTDWRARARTLASIAYFLINPMTLMSTPEGSVRLTGAMVSPNLFATLGAQPLLGRTFDPDAPSGEIGVVLGVGAWRRYFQSDPNIVGRTIALKTVDYTAGFLDGTSLPIIGVMPSDFDFPIAQTDFWAPITPGSVAATSRVMGTTIALLRNGESPAAAIDEANVIGDSLRPRTPTDAAIGGLPEGMRRFDIDFLKERLVAPMRPALRTLAVSVAVVLLIACANIANLLLARGTARQREIAVRRALGATRVRIAKQLLAETTVLSAIGGLVGALLAIGGVSALKAVASVDVQGVFRLSGAFSAANGSIIPRLHELTVDLQLLGFAIFISFLTAALCGVLPAIRLSRVGHAGALSARGNSGSGGALRSDTRLRDALVVGQLVLATTLLVSAGLLVNSFIRLSHVDPGYQASRVLTFYLVMPKDYSTVRKAALVEELLAELRRTPGVEAAGYSYAGPLLGVVDYMGVFVPEGRTREEMQDNPSRPDVRSVSHEFFRTMGVRLIEGRWFDERDDATASPVIVINRTMMQRLFDNRSPVGSFVHFDGRMDLAPQQIIGVVDDMRQERMDLDASPQLFIDYRQMLALTQARGMPIARQETLAFGFSSFVVRTNGDPAALMPTIHSLVGRIEPAAGIDAIAPMDRLIASSLTRQRFYALLLGIFAAMAAVLAAIGIYGVLAYTVLQRTQEIGVRMALGAHRRQVLSAVLGRGAVLSGIGIGLGIAGAAGLARYLSGMLYGLTPLDPTTYVAVATLFALVALLASYVPARRATKVDPMVALRCE